jgi:ribosomal protein L32
LSAEGQLSDMGRLMDKLNVTCRACGYKHIPRRLSARYHDTRGKRIHLWECKQCKHIWVDTAFKAKGLFKR